MKEKPLILPGGAPMIRAVLEGRKSRFTVPLKCQPDQRADWIKCDMNYIWRAGVYAQEVPEFGTWICPFGEPGQRLWVKETHYIEPGAKEAVANGATLHEWVEYRSDGEMSGEFCWKPPMHMPRWASRITLEIVNVRVQRLQEISEEEAKAEGATSRPKCDGYQHLHTGWSMAWDDSKPNYDQSLGSAKSAFLNFMNKLHGGDRWNFWYSWPSEYKIPLSEANPYVWAVEFRRV